MSSKTGYKNTIVFGEKGYAALIKFLAEKRASKVFVLCDENTQNYCLSGFLSKLSELPELEILEVESGEENKEIDTCVQLWAVMSEMGGDRHSVLINLGGGVLTDMGGFVASTFLRGIDFINIPTTLLAMVDASVGGKTGVNRAGLKNQIGLFRTAALTLIDVDFLDTLPANQMRSGLAEMLKHGLIADKNYWNKLQNLTSLNYEDLETLIRKSIEIKTEITDLDTEEKGLRKILNFGHTLGHAIESYFLEQSDKTSLLHGEAIAIGMILESYLSYKICGLPEPELIEIKETILHTFTKTEFLKADIEAVKSLLKYDKKNESGSVNFVLLSQIGKAETDCHSNSNTIDEAFSFYAE